MKSYFEKLHKTIVFLILTLTYVFAATTDGLTSNPTQYSASGETLIKTVSSQGAAITLTTYDSGGGAIHSKIRRQDLSNENAAPPAPELISEEAVTITADFNQQNIYIGGESGNIFHISNTDGTVEKIYNTGNTTKIRLITGGESAQVAVLREASNAVEIYYNNASSSEWIASKKFIPIMNATEYPILSITGFWDTDSQIIVAAIDKDSVKYACSYQITVVEYHYQKISPIRCREYENLDKLEINKDEIAFVNFGATLSKFSFWNPRNGEVIFERDITKAISAIFPIPGVSFSVFYVEYTGSNDQGVFLDEITTSDSFSFQLKNNYESKSIFYDKTLNRIIISGFKNPEIMIEVYKPATSCPNSCLLCAGPTAKCFLCDDSNNLNNGANPRNCIASCPNTQIQKKCLDDCPAGFGKDSLTGTCKRCLDTHCLTCSANFKICETCKDGATPTAEGICVECQSEGYFRDLKLGDCKLCKNTCKTCDVVKENCTNCYDNYFRNVGECLVTCPDEKYGDLNSVCQKCNPESEYFQTFGECFFCTVDENGKEVCPIGRDFEFINPQNIKYGDTSFEIKITPKFPESVEIEEIRGIFFEDKLIYEKISVNGEKTELEIDTVVYDESETQYTKLLVQLNETLTYGVSDIIKISKNEAELNITVDDPKKRNDLKFTYLKTKSVETRVRAILSHKNYNEATRVASFGFEAPLGSKNLAEDYEILLNKGEEKVDFSIKKIEFRENSNNQVLEVSLDLKTNFDSVTLTLISKKEEFDPIKIEKISFVASKFATFMEKSTTPLSITQKVISGLNIFFAGISVKSILKISYQFNLLRILEVKKPRSYDYYLKAVSDNFLDIIPNPFQAKESYLSKKNAEEDFEKKYKYCWNFTSRLIENDFMCFNTNSQGHLYFQILLLGALQLIIKAIVRCLKEQNSKLKIFLTLIDKKMNKSFWIQFFLTIQIELVTSGLINLRYAPSVGFYEFFNFFFSLFLTLSYFFASFICVQWAFQLKLMKKVREEVDKIHYEKINNQEKTWSEEYCLLVKSELKEATWRNLGFYTQEIEMQKNLFLPLIVVLPPLSFITKASVMMAIVLLSCLVNFAYSPYKKKFENFVYGSLDFFYLLVLLFLIGGEFLGASDNFREKYLGIFMIVFTSVPIFGSLIYGLYQSVFEVKKLYKKNRIQDLKKNVRKNFIF